MTTAALVPLLEAAPETSGAKSAACAELERVAASSKGGFSTPRGAVLPFGSMELAIKVGTSALRSARLPVNLIGSPINYANRLIGSPISSQSTGGDPI